MSTFDDDELYRDDPAEPWTMPPAERKTLRETNPLPVTPHYPPSVMVETSWGFRVPRHLREACENAFHDAKDRMRVRGEEAESEQSAPMTQEPAQAHFGVEKYDPPPQSPASAKVSQDLAYPRPLARPRLLGWEPPPPDHVEAYLRAGGS
jgi:hypothetical protein